MSTVTEAIAKYAVGGDADMVICVLPNANVMVASREPKALTELTPAIQKKLFRTANDIAILAYEATQAHGTNVIGMSSDHAHYLVVARSEEDGLPLRWNPGKSTPKELGDLAGKLKDATWTIGKRDVTDVSRPVVSEAKPAQLKPTPKEPEVKEVEMERADMHSPRDQSGHDLSDVAADIQTKVRKGPRDELDYRIKNFTRRR